MLNTVEYKQASIKKLPGTKEVYVLNQTFPVYVKNEVLMTGEDIVSVDVDEDNTSENRIIIKLTQKGMELINKVANDKAFPMLVFFVNGKSLRVIHKVNPIDEPEVVMVVSKDEDRAFIGAFAELIKSGISS
jgi:hypothetical protein